MKRVVKYKFVFHFNNNHSLKYEKFFENRMRLPIWGEEEPDNCFTGEFLDFEIFGKNIIGNMNVLSDTSENLHDKKNKKYFMNHPEDIVGHMILLE